MSSLGRFCKKMTGSFHPVSTVSAYAIPGSWTCEFSTFLEQLFCSYFSAELWTGQGHLRSSHCFSQQYIRIQYCEMYLHFKFQPNRTTGSENAFDQLALTSPLRNIIRWHIHINHFQEFLASGPACTRYIIPSSPRRTLMCEVESVSSMP